MKSNILIKGAAVLIIAVLAVVVLKGLKTSKQEQQAVQAVATTDGNSHPELSAIESGPTAEDNGLADEFSLLKDDFILKEFGVDTDSPVETMRTLTNETRAVREDSVLLQKENRQLKQKVEQLLKMEDSLNKRVQSKFNKAEQENEQKRKELESTQNLTKKMMTKLEQKLELMSKDDDKKKKKGGAQTANGFQIGDAEIPTGLGYVNEHVKLIHFGG